MQLFSLLSGIDRKELKAKREILSNYASDNGIDFTKSIEVNLARETQKNKLLKNIINDFQVNDSLIVDELSSFGRTTFKIIKQITEIQKYSVNLYFIKENLHLYAEHNATTLLLFTLNHVEESNINVRKQRAKNTRDIKQTKLGRQKGLRTKSMYDKHQKRILRLHEGGLSNAKILEKIKKIDNNLVKGTTQSLGKYIKKIKDLKVITTYIENRPNENSGYDLELNLMNQDGKLSHNEKSGDNVIPKIQHKSSLKHNQVRGKKKKR